MKLLAGGKVLGKGVYPVKVTVMEGDLPISTNDCGGCADAFQNLHSQEIIFTLTEHSKSALNYRQLTHLFGRRSKGKEDFGCVRSARGARGRREGSGGPRAQIPFPLPFERHAAFQLIFLYGKCIYNCCSVISCRLARKT